MNPLIGPENHLQLLAVMLFVVWLGCWAERHRVLRRVPGVVWILVTGTLLSNFSIIPFDAPLYGIIFAILLPLAVPLLLLKANMARMLRESGKVLLIFLVGSVTVCIGGFVAYALFDLGPSEPKIMATYVAAWIGGMVNMLSISQMTQLSPTEFSVALSASAPVSIIGLTLLCMLPSIGFVRRNIPITLPEPVDSSDEQHAAGEPRFRPAHIAGALAISAVICVAADALIKSGLFPARWNIETYNLFIITVLTIIAANLFPRTLGAIEGDFDMGMLLMYLFFAAIGAGTDAVKFVTTAPIYFAYGLTIIVVHLALLLIIARIFRFDLAETIIGSGANIVGAAPAAGVASSLGWKHLVTPAIATGMLGYAVANFFGLTIYELLK